ncbi:STAS domain-containing protein [Catenuloplanes atrovinosus]|uniref:Anti-anti-sigma regulatory factor n=1 Tax=Catenuloplanes atrovinosus TaxID=137266 RepID=A0AAE3YVG4_9ACTN|nr:STAS domain-containing protein [Catenuloplanes atrovinosus]MDR7279265.1 anti-anti-sigma regulatory factor [Catenuloplanes atrovinosus]
MLTWTVDPNESRAVVTLRGDLSVGETGRLRTALLKCLAEQPEALLVDLSGLRVLEPHALSVFTAVTRQAATWPGMPVLLCGSAPATAELLAGGGFGKLSVTADLAEAHALLDAGGSGMQMMADDLLPIRGAARHARDVVTDACARWSLPHLVAPATVIAGEMVANVIDHVGTMMTLRVSLRSRFLYVAVRDGSSEPPTPLRPPFRPGAGLALIHASATHWGWMPAADGKVVWAALSLRGDAGSDV